MCITSQRTSCWIWKWMRHLFFKLQKYWFDVHICSIMVEWGVILYFRVIMNPGSIRTELEA
jgi:hypothetical protein